MVQLYGVRSAYSASYMHEIHTSDVNAGNQKDYTSYEYQLGVATDSLDSTIDLYHNIPHS